MGFPRISSLCKERLEPAACMSDNRADDGCERMLTLARPRTRNRGDDLESGNIQRLGDVVLVLFEEAPQHSSEPGPEPGAYARVDVVLVVPKFVSELLTLYRDGDRDNYVGKPAGRTSFVRCCRYSSPGTLDSRLSSRRHIRRGGAEAPG